MSGRVSFSVTVTIKNPETIPEISARLADFRPAFENILKEWARDNKDKFQAGRGMESSGAEIDPGVSWQGLAASTIKAKRRKGQPNALMHATGALEAALTNPDGFFNAMSATDVYFGTPMDYADEIKLKYNFEKRQVVFLSVDDQQMVRKNFIDYVTLGGNYKDIMFKRGLQAVAQRGEARAMDMAFNDTINVPGFL